MATYYWVGGSGIWNNSSLTNWSNSSGGYPGAGIPGASDTVIFDANSDVNQNFFVTLGSDITVKAIKISNLQYQLQLNRQVFSLTLTGNADTIWDVSDTSKIRYVNGTPSVICNSTASTGVRRIINGVTTGSEQNAINLIINGGVDEVVVEGHFNKIDFSGFKGRVYNNNRTIYGDFILDPLMSFESGNSATIFAGNIDQTLNGNGVIISCPITITGTSKKTLASPLLLGDYNLTLTSGTFDSAGYHVWCSRVLASNANTRGLLLASSEVELSGDNIVWDVSDSTGLTLDAAQSTIILDPQHAQQTFAGGNHQYGKLKLISNRLLAEVVAIAGGGSGANSSYACGGGGAGGYFDGTLYLDLNKPINVVIGAGAPGVSFLQNGNKGSNTILNRLTMIGGGYGARGGEPGGSGGSGGGSGGGAGSDQNKPGAGVFGQGNSGGFGQQIYGAGGGGAGSIGGAPGTEPGVGGAGRVSSITGVSVARAGGGGGASYLASSIYAGRDGGGYGVGSGYGGSGDIGKGGGGGATGGGSGALSGSGGSGIVIIKIPIEYTINFSQGVTANINTTTVPGYKIITITATSTLNETITLS